MKSNLLQSSLAAPYLTAPAFQNLLVPFFSFSPTPAPCRIQIVHKQSSIQPNIHTHPHPLAMLKSLISFGKQGIKSYDNQPHQHSQLGSRMFLPQSWTNNFLQILAQRKTYCLPIELDHLDGTDAKISHHLPIHAVPLQCRMHPPDWSLQWMDCSHRQQ